MKRQANILFAICFLAIFALVSCAKPCVHEYRSEIVKTANCAEEGEKKFTCTKCGESYTETIPKNTDHSYAKDESKTVKPSYTKPGNDYFTCTRCGHSYSAETPKLSSKWSINYYEDSYGKKTSDGYASAIFNGSYYDMNGNRGTLTAVVFGDKSFMGSIDASIRLLKGSINARFYSGDIIEMDVRTPKGATTSFRLNNYYANNVSFENDAYERVFINLLSQNDSLECSLSVFSKYTSWFGNFDIDCAGFSEFYELTGK